MRVTHRMMMESAIRNMDDNLAALYKLQQKASTGKEFQRSSDDPSTVSTALTLRSTIEINKSYVNTTEFTNDWMSATDNAFDQMLDIAEDAVTYTQTGISDTEGDDERTALANEINSLLQEVVDVANTKHLGKYIFAGFSIDTTPYTLDDPSTVTYHGDTGVMVRNIGPSQTISQNIIGETYFRDLFESLIAARDALNSNDSTAIQTALGDLEEALEVVNQGRTLNATRQNQVQLSKTRLENTQTDLKILLSDKEDANLTEVASLIANQETTYQVVLEVSNRALSALSLFDLLS
ncbi:MAG: flagellar hook-associated protein FlgL [Anaerolineales bacterium]|nr:flagellar hook-associated protein FlgL [Anaerolineales bacterium]